MATVAAKIHQLLVLLEQQIRSKDLIRMKRSDDLRLLTVGGDGCWRRNLFESFGH